MSMLETEKLPETQPEKPGIATLLEVVSIAAFIGAVAALFATLVGASQNDRDAATYLVWAAESFLSGILLRGFAAVIAILSRIEFQLRK